jgi:hypothetical protein
MNKGQLMKRLYDEEELQNIDPGLPQQIIDELRVKNEDTYYYVMNYNYPNTIFGKLNDMRKVARKRKIKIE